MILEAAAGPAQEVGVEVETHAREGDPADAILNVAEEVGASVIVVGNKGMTGPGASSSAACRTRSPITRPAASTSRGPRDQGFS